jgi:hypothetical protein
MAQFPFQFVVERVAHGLEIGPGGLVVAPIPQNCRVSVAIGFAGKQKPLVPSLPLVSIPAS